MYAAVLREFEKPLSVKEVQIESPRTGELMVRIAASGVCRSDLHAQQGRSSVARLPMVLGHEGAGIVEETGAGVAGFAVGDAVVIALYGPCGACGHCRAGRINRCMSETRQNNMFGLMPDGSTRISCDGHALHPMVGSGSLAEYAVVRAQQAVKIDPDIPLDCACLAGCGVTTGIGAVLNTAKVEPGATVAVIGCGGVGLNVVQGSRIAGAARIVAIDTQTSKLDLASDLGATDCIQIGPEESAAEAILGRVRGGVDYAFEVIGSPAIVREAFASTRTGGTCVMVGSPPTGQDIAIDGRMLFSDRKLLGCMGGGNIPERDIPLIMDLYKRGALQLEPLIGQRLPLAQVNDAFEALKKGELARSVVTF